MRTKTRFISLLLALVMSFSLITTAFAANPDIPEDAITITDDDGNVIYLTDSEGNVVGYYDPATGEPVWDTVLPTDDTFVDEDLALVTSFKDVKTTAWYYKDVMECAKLGIVAGFEDGTFRPENKVSSVQLITMLTRTFYNDKVETAQKSKPSGTPWYWANKKVAENVGMSDKLKAIDDNAMNRYEMAIALRNVAVNHGKTITTEQSNAAIKAIKEYTSIPSNYRTPVKTCYALGIISGMADGSFAGTQSMTRAQACTVIVRMLKLLNKYNPGDKDNEQYDDGKNQNTENNNQPAQTAGKLANGKDATVANVEAILAELKREYPEGTPWGYSTVPNTNYYNHSCGSSHDVKKLMNSIGGTNFSLKYACGGWMCMVSERIFGETGAPAREVTDVNKVRPGDIVVQYDKNDSIYHVAIVEVTGRNQYQNNEYRYDTCDGNSGPDNAGYVSWADENTDPWGAIGKRPSGITIRVFTRYPN